MIFISKNREFFFDSSGNKIELDETGRVFSSNIKTKIFSNKKIIFADFDGLLAHSFWRSQELTLFNNYNHMYKKPILDFGCGDGSFSSCIFKKLEYGVDIDEKAMKEARLRGTYSSLVHYDDLYKRIKKNSISTILSCSVLEHTHDVRDCINKINSLLKKNGKFYLSVPNATFSLQLDQLGGNGFSKNINQRMSHRNLFNLHQWKELLINNNFKIIKIINFQPIMFTSNYFKYSFFSRKILGRFKFLYNLYFKWILPDIYKQVEDSICNTTEGANFFIIAEKK